MEENKLFGVEDLEHKLSAREIAEQAELKDGLIAAVEIGELTAFVKLRQNAKLRMGANERYYNSYVVLTDKADLYDFNKSFKELGTRYLPDPVEMTLWGEHKWPESIYGLENPLHLMLLGDDKRIYAHTFNRLIFVAHDMAQFIKEGFVIRANYGLNEATEETYTRVFTQEDILLQNGLLEAVYSDRVEDFVAENALKRVYLKDNAYIELCGLNDTYFSEHTALSWECMYLPFIPKMTVLGNYKFENMYAYDEFINVILLAENKRVYAYYEDTLLLIAFNLSQFIQEGRVIRALYEKEGYDSD
ncbi:hypothetical protein [Ranid herpesvirus 3]|uniref:Uncharacterized protein n=1 Tax=Ranid herpesvirus 3 TaxID=1987509 RepID=A0A1X9T547_9VIRU|nr:hypothetical protein [Ranid herpesvirus 3]ARR28824.1 hypothetical protein [Ranid herpesvirus 3]